MWGLLVVLELLVKVVALFYLFIFILYSLAACKPCGLWQHSDGCIKVSSEI